eukprot:6183869-Pleurochrysis_carterae.AAC.2
MLRSHDASMNLATIARSSAIYCVSLKYYCTKLNQGWSWWAERTLPEPAPYLPTPPPPNTKPLSIFKV